MSFDELIEEQVYTYSERWVSSMEIMAVADLFRIQPIFGYYDKTNSRLTFASLPFWIVDKSPLVEMEKYYLYVQDDNYYQLLYDYDNTETSSNFTYFLQSTKSFQDMIEAVVSKQILNTRKEHLNTLRALTSILTTEPFRHQNYTILCPSERKGGRYFENINIFFDVYNNVEKLRSLSEDELRYVNMFVPKSEKYHREYEDPPTKYIDLSHAIACCEHQLSTGKRKLLSKDDKVATSRKEKMIKRLLKYYSVKYVAGRNENKKK